jgi:hypothetical protein
MSTINDSDLLAVERSGTLYQVRSDEMSTLNDTDLLAIERSGTLYKIQAQDLGLINGSMDSPVNIVTPLNGAGLQEGQPLEPLSSAITAVNGSGALSYSTSSITSLADVTTPAVTYSIQNYTNGNEPNSLANRMFDGSLTSFNIMSQGHTAAAAGIGVTFTNPITVNTSLRIYCYRYNYHTFDGGWLWINNSSSWASPNTIQSQVPLGYANRGWVTVPLSFLNNSQLTQVRCGSGDSNGNNGGSLSQYGIAAVEVDGHILRNVQTVTGTRLTFTDSTNLNLFTVGDNIPSAQHTVTGPPDPSLLLDGNITTVSDTGSVATLTFPQAVSGVVEVYTEGSIGGNRYMVEVDDASTFYTSTGLSGWVSLYTATNLTSLKITRVGASNSTPTNEQRIAAYKVGGKLITNTSEVLSIDTNNSTLDVTVGWWYTGMTTSASAPYATALTFADDTYLNQIIATATMADSTAANITSATTSAITNVAASTQNGHLLTFTDTTDFYLFKVDDIVGTYQTPTTTANSFYWSDPHGCYGSGTGGNNNEAAFYAGSGPLENYWGNCQAGTTFYHSFNSAPIHVPQGTVLKQQHRNNDNTSVAVRNHANNTNIALTLSSGYWEYTVTDSQGLTFNRVQTGLNTVSGGRNRDYRVYNMQIILPGSSATFIPKYPNVTGNIVVRSIDSSTKQIDLSTGGTWSNGGTLTKTVPLATAGSLLDRSGNTLYFNNVSNTFYVGSYLRGAQVTHLAPSASSIVFTTSNGSTTAYSGVDSSLSSRIWEVSTGSSATGPWSTPTLYTDTGNVITTQDGATAWANPTLANDTFFRVKVTYTSANAAQSSSGYHYFKTSA